MKRSVAGFVGTIVLGAAVLAGLTEANAVDRRGLIGGMSAAEVMGVPYYPAPVHYEPPAGPPPGCAIRRQRVWDGYRWHWRKLRICH